MRRVTGLAEAQIESSATPLARVVQASIARDPTAATAPARDLVQVALAGTALLYRQNSLIDVQSGLLAEQNQRIAEQTGLLIQQAQLAEAERNAALSVEISAIADRIGTAAEQPAARFRAVAVAKGMAGDSLDQMVNFLDPVADLDRGLILRIASDAWGQAVPAHRPAVQS